MIAVGIHLGGGESQCITSLLRATGLALSKACGPWVGNDDYGPGDPIPQSGPYFKDGDAPALNVVFYVPGSLMSFDDLKQIEAARYSRKKKLLLVAVPVPRAVAASGGSVEFVIGALRRANAIAAEVFAKKGSEPYNTAEAERIVSEVENRLRDQGFKD